MLITFDGDVVWDASTLMVWANCGADRILCRAGRATINELTDYWNASSPEIARDKRVIADLLKPSFEFKIRKGAFDPGDRKVVTVARKEIVSGPPPPKSYYVAWIIDGRTNRFAHPHAELNSALDFACEAFKIGCSDVWITDDQGRQVADRVEIAKYADQTGKPYN
jgi:hypothetical protein